MTKIVTSLLAGTAFFGLMAAAQAADMGSSLRGPSVVPTLSDPGSSTTATGWYLRGDVGVALDRKPGFESIEPGLNKTVTQENIASSPSIGLGIGYQFNDYLRGDITADYYTSRNISATATYTGGDAVNGFTANTSYYSGTLTSTAIMANGYIDLGNYSGFTPYVGAGVGVAYNTISPMMQDARWTVITAPATAGQNLGYMPGHSRWNLAWALHTGFSYDLSPNLKLDAGYSYKDFGSIGGNGESACATGVCGTETYKIKHLGFHDFHVGARWMFDPIAAKAPVYASAPVVAKY